VLLSETLRSSTLKLAFVYVIVFSSAIFTVLGYVYWSTATYVGDISDRSLRKESAVLVKTYNSTGLDGLIALINNRVVDQSFDQWVYLLTDGSLIYRAGNLKSWPASLQGNRGWGDFTPTEWRAESIARPPLRATYEALPHGYHLLVARKVDDLERFREKIAIGLG